MIKKLRIKFIAVNMAIVVILLGTLFSFLYTSTRMELERNAETVLHEVSENPMQSMFPFNRFRDKPDGPDKRNRINLPYFVMQTNANGDLISIIGNYFDDAAEPDLLAVLNEVRERSETSGRLKDYHLRYLVSETPLGLQYAFVDTSAEEATLSHLLRECMLAGSAVFLAFLLLSVFLSGWAVSPVKKAWQDQKQFVSDASHELKTPLTVIHTNAELLTSPDSTDADRKQYTDNILVMCRQMRGLVEGLLDIARVDNGSVQTALQDMSLSRAVDDAILPFEPLFFEQELSLESHIQPDIHIKGSEGHLKQLVSILLDNAGKYASPLGKCEVTLEKYNRTHCRLTVANEGDALSTEELENIFKRFYRGDRARAMNQSYGLGLAIAQQITTEHGGKIHAESKDGWNRFIVELPTL